MSKTFIVEYQDIIVVNKSVIIRANDEDDISVDTLDKIDHLASNLYKESIDREIYNIIESEEDNEVFDLTINKPNIK